MIAFILLCAGSLASMESMGASGWTTGNGRLSASLDAAGRLAEFHWPSASTGQHLDAMQGVSGAAGWMLDGPDGPVDFGSRDWIVETAYAAADSLVLVTHYRERSGSRSAEQWVFAAPDKDVLVVRLRLRGFAPDARLIWMQRFSPYDGLVPGFSQAASTLRRLHAFGGGYDPEARILEHFRPTNAGREDWKRLREWTAGTPQSADIVAEFAPGVYIGTASPNAITGGGLVSDATRLDWDEADAKPLTLRVAGRAAGLIEIAPGAEDGDLHATVLIGASPTRQALRALLESALRDGVERLRVGAEGLGRSWLAGAESAAPRPLLNLFLSTDAATGAVARSVSGVPGLACSSVFDSAWASAALDRHGHADRAARALGFHLETVRRESGPSGPAGSLPRYVNAAGRPASESNNADPESAAWLLAACWRHAASIPTEEGRAWLASVWPVLEPCADYLAREPQVGAALSGAAPAAAVPLEILRAHYLGLESSRRMGDALALDEPGLRRDRRSEIYSRIRFRRLNQVGAEETGNPWIDWWVDALPDSANGEQDWDVLRSENAPPLSEEALHAALPRVGVGEQAPMALRDALRCLLP